MLHGGDDTFIRSVLTDQPSSSRRPAASIAAGASEKIQVARRDGFGGSLD
jgi:hypothetical protein